MPDLPEEAVQAALAAMGRDLRARPLDPFFKGDEALTRAVLEAAAPILADQIRREVAAEFRAKAARIRAIPDDGLNMGQMWHRHELADDYEQKADEIDPDRPNGDNHAN